MFSFLKKEINPSWYLLVSQWFNVNIFFIRHRYAVEQEMLSYASGVLGQSLIDNMSGKNAIRREALEAFLNSARYHKVDFIP